MTETTEKAPTIRWTRRDKWHGRTDERGRPMVFGENFYTSDCGRFRIESIRAVDGRRFYVLDVDGKPARRSEREHDRLVEAKFTAELIKGK